MASIQKLGLAKTILEQKLAFKIKDLLFEPSLARIMITFRDGSLLYIRYNDYNQYSYSIIFSPIDLDRCRFDNYDDRWQVDTRPHHFHPRFNKLGFPSPMKGIPNEDIELLCDLIISGKLISKDFRF